MDGRAGRKAKSFGVVPIAAAGVAFLAGCGSPDSGEAAEGEVAAGAAAEGEVALVTGSTGGLGREVALELGARGWHVIVHGRNEERGAEVVQQIEDGGEGSASFHRADLASYAEVRELAATVLEEHPRLDVLVNNAGIWLQDEERRLSEDGHELHLQVNYLSGVLLTRLLLPRLRESAPARIVNVASSAQRPLDFDDPMMDADYSDGRGYAQSKLAQVVFTMDLARELEGSGVTVTALHPATFMDTEMVLSRGGEPRASVEEGAEAVLNLVIAPGIGTGEYFRGLEPARANDQAYDEEAQLRLRELTHELVGWTDDG